jgi:hypothetical protein
MRLSGSEENEDSEANSESTRSKHAQVNPMSYCSLRVLWDWGERYGLQAPVGLSMAEPFLVGNQPTEKDKCIQTIRRWGILCWVSMKFNRTGWVSTVPHVCCAECGRLISSPLHRNPMVFGPELIKRRHWPFHRSLIIVENSIVQAEYPHAVAHVCCAECRRPFISLLHWICMVSNARWSALCTSTMHNIQCIENGILLSTSE